VGVDGVACQQHRAGTGGVRHADDGSCVARVGDAHEHGDQRMRDRERGVERAAHGDVQQVADGDEALRGDRVGERVGGPVRHRHDRDARRAGQLQQLGEPLCGRGGDEQLVHGAVAGERLADRLGALDEEPPGPIAARASQQLAGCNDARGALGAGRCRMGCGDGAQAAVPSWAGRAVWAGALAFATSTSAANAAGSLTASSARILRSTWTSAALRPWMKRL
jgi:hypothetical protein